MKIGFTGTQLGCSEEQFFSFRCFIEDLKPTEFHHGDCIGADSQAHRVVREISSPLFRINIIIHPPLNPDKRALCESDERRTPKDYLVRNRDIVNETDLLIACPKEANEIIRSGTWSTIRYAKKMGRVCRIICPDGSVLI